VVIVLWPLHAPQRVTHHRMSRKCHEETSHRPRLEVCGVNKLEVTPLFDHLVGAGGEHGRHINAKRVRSL
jgi:hypothetical protein